MREEKSSLCTLKTAQPDGKHLVKKPVANVSEDTRRNATILQLVSGEKRIKEKSLTATQIVTIKLLRAQGGCHGTGRRRKTWQAAKSHGEPQAGCDPWMSEWGNPAGAMSRHP